MDRPTATAETAVLKVTVYAKTERYYDTSTWVVNHARPSHWDARAEFVVPEEAAKFAARFPKVAKVRATTLSGPWSWGKGADQEAGIVHAHGKLEADGVNGGRNETAVARLHRLLVAADRLGVRVEYVGTGAINAYPTLNEAMVAVGLGHGLPTPPRRPNRRPAHGRW
jgi:hypothetical protein